MKHLLKMTGELFKEGRRVVGPLMGFPGVPLINSTIKICQQNYKIHFQAIQDLAQNFEPDFIFPMMDLAVEANALGLYTLFPINDSATTKAADDIENFIKHVSSIDITADGRALSYAETIRQMKANLPKSILTGAYVSGPFTLAAQITGLPEAILSTMSNPDTLHKLIETIVPVIMEYAEMQLKAGADMLCILEPSAALLSPAQFREFSVQYLQPIIEISKKYKADSIYHVCGNTMHLYKLMAVSGVDALSIDSKEAGVNLSEIAAHVPDDIVLMGNINPTGKMLNGSAKEVSLEVETLLSEMNNYPNFILSSGCDLPEDTPAENIEAFMNTGRNYRNTLK